MAVVLVKGSVPYVKGCPSILALFCCHLATREFSNMLPAAASEEKAALAVGSASPAWGNLELVIVAAAVTGQHS